MRELLLQMGTCTVRVAPLLEDPGLGDPGDRPRVTEVMRSRGFPVENFGVPLAGSLIPWIDPAGRTARAAKSGRAMAETNKILGRDDNPVPIDGTLRAHRCHALPQPGPDHQAQCRSKRSSS
jgi:aspartate-semialdehyde dehydrogenase